jgi:hypothetical protein
LIYIQVFEEAVCAGLGHKKYGGSDFLTECLDLFAPSSEEDSDEAT